MFKRVIRHSDLIPDFDEEAPLLCWEGEASLSRPAGQPPNRLDFSIRIGPSIG
jgi:hypothetical protein